MPSKVNSPGVGMQDVEKLRQSFAEKDFEEVEFLAYSIYKWAETRNKE